MIIARTPFAMDPIDADEETSASRIGRRIREIRTTQGLSQSELGERVGLSADRIQKYENGARKPKPELLKKIAAALNVRSTALIDPVPGNFIGAMYAFFEMEDLYRLKVKRMDGRLTLMFGDGISGTMNDYLNEWEKEIQSYFLELADASTEEEVEEIKKAYKLWKWQFPEAIIRRTEKNIRKARIQEKIDLLNQELSELED